MYGNVHRLPFGRRNDITIQEELLSADVCGPFKPTFQGKRENEYSGHCKSRDRDRARKEDRRGKSHGRERDKERRRSLSRDRGSYKKKPNKLTFLERLGIELRLHQQ
jgi:hypothetical protein